jgi:NADH-quinone oxidoreductase subunit A
MQTDSMVNYLPILMMFLLALVVASVLVTVSRLLGQRISTRAKLMPYECGKDPKGAANERFSVKFYMVALMFILFDIEAIFFVPWAVVFKDLGKATSKSFVFLEMMVFMAFLLAGYVYVWKKGVLDWNK